MDKEKGKKELLLVTPSPHITKGETTSRGMWMVSLALLPALLASLYFFGLKALELELVAIASAVVTEALIQRLRGIPITVLDGSAVLTGLLLAFNLPPGVPLWLAAVGAAFGIGVAKQAFGGLGHNIFNPALAGRIFVMHSWLTRMTTWSPPHTSFYAGVDALTYATPLGAAKESVLHWLPGVSGGYNWFDMFWGNIGGCIGETSALALLLGGLFLLWRGQIRWHTPVAFIATVALLTWVLPARAGSVHLSPLYHILGGGLFLGAFFMATDPVTAPLTGKGMLFFGAGCGLIAAFIRLYGGFPEGVCYSIVIMNAFTPLIDKYTRPRIFGA